ISVAGAVATATHGSGHANGNLATAVSAVQLVTATGDVIDIKRGDADFNGIVVGLGGFGVVTAVTLDLRPTFELSQYVYENLPADEFVAHADEILTSAYSVSLFTDWRDDQINQVWVKTNQAPEPLGATLADGQRHPVPGMSPESCTEQQGVPGPWYERLPHFRLEFTPSSGEELQSEYFVPRDKAVAAFQALTKIQDQIAPILQISEIRTTAADDLWLSPSNGRDSVVFHFTCVKDTEAVPPVLSVIEEQLAPYGARPHWGKLFTVPPAILRGRYDRYADFQQLLSQYDPTNKFRNDFLDRYFYSGSPET
ncbi:MAG TPA: D-arabinono-1,4-lactone oxidase, partial [Pseudonocardiaceae bacterium]|nr:D-arabinono-1,4-lactone oxidase [Pseudonocardiaceae bacterium]